MLFQELIQIIPYITSLTDHDEWEPELLEEWKPPTEAEMKVLQAKRERSDKISKIMGDYLLKGYKMLGSSCGVCGVSYIY